MKGKESCNTCHTDKTVERGRTEKRGKQPIRIAPTLKKNANTHETFITVNAKRYNALRPKRTWNPEPGITEKQIQLVVRVALELGTSGFRVRRVDHLATQSPCSDTNKLFALHDMFQGSFLSDMAWSVTVHYGSNLGTVGGLVQYGHR